MARTAPPTTRSAVRRGREHQFLVGRQGGVRSLRQIAGAPKRETTQPRLLAFRQGGGEEEGEGGILRAASVRSLGRGAHPPRNQTVPQVVTLAKKQTHQSWRQAQGMVHDDDVLPFLFEDLAARYADRPGGYTRVLKAGNRLGDHAPMAFIEFVDNGLPPLRPVRSPCAIARLACAPASALPRRSRRERPLLSTRRLRARSQPVPWHARPARRRT